MGACILLGYSDGGMAALDLAAQVEKAGRRVSDIILLDAFRGTKKIEGEVLREFIGGLEQGMEEMGVSYLRDLVVQNIGAYQEYLSRLDNITPVDAVLHLIVSEGEDIRRGLAQIPKDRGWNTLTNKMCIPYQGAGRHDQMLAEPHLKPNASIIAKILSKCKKY